MHPRGLSLFVLCSLQTFLSTVSLAQQAPPDSISFQGYVTDLFGAPYDTTVSLTTKLYKDGVEVYSQVHAGTPISGGVFNVILGPLDTLSFDRTVFLGVAIGGDAEIVPRTPLTLVPYAQSLRALRVFPVPVDEGVSSAPNIVGGVRENSVASGIVGATISGGGSYELSEPLVNIVQGDYGTIGGGFDNEAGSAATVAGGVINSASGVRSAIAGGSQNEATGSYSSIGGGSTNVATGQASTIPGGSGNKATRGYSFAAGYRAEANHSGTFVWADSASSNGEPAFVSTKDNQFLIRATGGVGINTNDPQDFSLSVNGIADVDTLKIGLVGGTGGYIAYSQNGPPDFDYAFEFGSGLTPKDDDAFDLGSPTLRWNAVYASEGTINTSDERAKTNVDDLSYGLNEILDLRPVSFLWKNHPESGERFGLIAQEVAQTMPELVRSDGDALLGMNYSEVIPVLVKAIQEQQAEIERMKAVIERAGLE